MNNPEVSTEVGKLERVYTYEDFCDRPRGGIANFDNAPHLYACCFDEEADEYSDIFLLKPVSASIFTKALEEWEAFERWCDARKQGKASSEPKPVCTVVALELQKLEAKTGESIIRARGKFHDVLHAKAERGHRYNVIWSPLAEI